MCASRVLSNSRIDVALILPSRFTLMLNRATFQLSYRQVSMDNLQVMDETAITLCKENNIPVLVFNVMERGNVLRAAAGQNVGTVVDSSEDGKGAH